VLDVRSILANRIRVARDSADEVMRVYDTLEDLLAGDGGERVPGVLSLRESMPNWITPLKAVLLLRGLEPPYCPENFDKPLATYYEGDELPVDYAARIQELTGSGEVVVMDLGTSMSAGHPLLRPHSPSRRHHHEQAADGAVRSREQRG
jgi:hypothetical protein